MTNPFNETLVILMLTMVINLLFDRLIANGAWSATIQNNPTNYARFIRYANDLDQRRHTVINARLLWKHGG